MFFFLRCPHLRYFSLNISHELFRAETETYTNLCNNVKHVNNVWKTLSSKSEMFDARDDDAPRGRKSPIPRLGSQIISAARVAIRKFETRHPLVYVREK